jgi:hypothetical protein
VTVEFSRSSRILLGCWNLNGLSDYKQSDLLSAARAALLDVLVLCETHLTHEEELADWEKEVAEHGCYRWVGRPARRISGAAAAQGGRGSGGVGVLVRADWEPLLTVLPPCDSDCLVFVRLDFPNRGGPRPAGEAVTVGVRLATAAAASAPGPSSARAAEPAGSPPLSVCFGAAYVAPPGSSRFGAMNSALLDELHDRAELYRSEGRMVCVMGDFNAHIAEYPSTLPPEWSDSQICPDAEDGPIRRDDPLCMLRALRRHSVDPRGADSAAGATPAGVELVERMDAAGLVILNGLVDVKAGAPSRAAATRGDDSVIDFIMADSDHWDWLEAVFVDPATSSEVPSDHHLVRSAIRLPFLPLGDPRARAPILPDKVTFAVCQKRFQVSTKGDPAFFDELHRQCSTEMRRLADEWEEAAAAEAAAEPDAPGPIAMEERWAQFRVAVDRAASASLESKSKGHPPPAAPLRPRSSCRFPAPAAPLSLLPWKPARAVFRPGDFLLRQMKTQRREERKRHFGPEQPERTEEEEAAKRKLNQRIKNHTRKATRKRRQLEVDKVRSLAPRQWKEHWQALRKLAGPTASRSASAAPGAASSVLTPSGVASSDPADIRQEWTNFWSGLAREPAADDPRFEADEYQRIRLMVAQREEEMEAAATAAAAVQAGAPAAAAAAAAASAPAASRPDPESARSAGSLNLPITADEVEKSTRRLANHKAAGCDGIVGEILKYGGPEMQRVLVSLCQTAFSSGEVPLDWLRGIVVPIHKDGDRRLPSNYRPITLLSIAAKVYTGVLQSRLSAWVERSGSRVVVEEQGGFRPGRGCAEQLFTLTELIKLRRMRGRHTYACFLDIRKAYDTVWHEGLKLRLLESGISGAMYRAICSLYQAGESCLRLGGTAGYTDFFPVHTGVRQGCVLSPLLYSLFINGLALELRAAGAKFRLGAAIDPERSEDEAERICQLLYADDIVLLAESEADLQALMRIVGAYAARWRFEINPTKSACVRFNRTGATVPDSPMWIGPDSEADSEFASTAPAQLVPWSSCYRYLGVELPCSPGRPFALFRRRMLASATSAAGQLAAMGLKSGKLPVPLGVQVYRALVQPLLEFAAEVTSLAPWPAADRLHAGSAKRILQIPRTASTTAALGDLGFSTLGGRFQLLRLGLWGRIQRMEEGRPARQVYSATLRAYHSAAASLEGVAEASGPEEGWQVTLRETDTQAAKETHLWAAQIHRDLASIGLAREYWEQPEKAAAIKQTAWKSQCRRSVLQREASAWWRAVQARPPLLRFFSLVSDSRPSPSSSSSFSSSSSSAPFLSRSAYLDQAHGGWNDRVRLGRWAATLLRTNSHHMRVRTAEWEPDQAGLRSADRVLTCRLCGRDGSIEGEAHLLLDCRFGIFTQTRDHLVAQVEYLVRRSEAHAARLLGRRGPPAAIFHFASLPLADRLQILVGAAHPRVEAAGAGEQVARLALVVIGEWVCTMEEHLQELRELTLSS